MSKRLKKNAVILKALSKAHHGLNSTVIKGADTELIKCLCECAANLLNGNVPISSVHKSKLTRYKKGLRELAKRNTSFKKRKKILQKGGFLGALLAPIVTSVLAPLVSKVFN